MKTNTIFAVMNSVATVNHVVTRNMIKSTRLIVSSVNTKIKLPSGSLADLVARYKEELRNSKSIAKEALGSDYQRALLLWTKEMSVDADMSPEDYTKMVDYWKSISGVINSDNIEEFSSVDIAKKLRDIFCPSIRVEDMTDKEISSFNEEWLSTFVLRTRAEELKKESLNIIKMSMTDIYYDEGRVLVFDSSKASTFTNGKVDIKNPKIRVVGTAEDGISRMLKEKGLSSITVFIGEQYVGNSEEEALALFRKKEDLFTNGFFDVSTGKHYFPGFQNPSSVRQGNMLFIEANTWDEIFSLWVEITGVKSWEGFEKAFFNEGKVVMAKLLARVSSRGSNSFDTSRLSDKWSKFIKAARVSYVKDPRTEINRPYKTLDIPGHLEMAKDKARTVTPGDGQGIMSFTLAGIIATNMRIISENEFSEFYSLWKEAERNELMVVDSSRLDTIIKKIPSVFQIRHGEKKGILVRANLERFEQTKDVDVIIPESVRKFIGGEWKDYPLEICNYLKTKKSEYVSLNTQFIQSLRYDNPNSFRPIIDYWFDELKESLSNPMKAMQFHKIVESLNSETEESVPLVQAIKISSDLLNERQICNWRRKQYYKFITDMKVGRLLVPGLYSYEVCDPYALLKEWYGVNTDHLKYGEFYHNGLDCDCGLFRSPLIAPFEATKVKLTNNPMYRYLQNVIIFNMYDGIWDKMGGSDFDGDQCAIIPSNTEFGKLVVDGIREIPYEVWEEPQVAVKEEFNLKNLIKHLIRTAKTDNTGVITNYASYFMDIANHIHGSIAFAKMLGCEALYFQNPLKMGGNWGSENRFGRAEIPQAKMFNNKKVFFMRAPEEVFHDGTGFAIREGSNIGEISFDRAEELIKEYESKVEYLRIMQGREIDGAKTGVYAEGKGGVDFVDSVKTHVTPHFMISVKEAKGREIGKWNLHNVYQSLSLLGRIHDYTEKRENEIYDFLENGSDKIHLLYSLLTNEERFALKKRFKMMDGRERNVVEVTNTLKKNYNKSVYNIMKNISGDDATNAFASLKEEEEKKLYSLASMLDIPVEVVAVSCYVSTYNKESKQNEGLSYAWILSQELLSVFSRANKSYSLYRLPKSAERVYIKDNAMFVNGNKFCNINAEDSENVSITEFGNKLYAFIKKDSVNKCNSEPIIENETEYGVAKYKIGLYGFKFYMNICDYTNEFLRIVRENNYMFDIHMDETGRVVASVNGRKLASLMSNDNFDIVGKRVRAISKPTINPASINDMEILVVGSIN